MLARRATLNTANSWLRAFDGFAHEFHNMPIQAESNAGRIDLFEQAHEFKLLLTYRLTRRISKSLSIPDG